MSKPLMQACDIVTGKLDANAAVENGKYPFFTCAPDPLSINTFDFDDDAILLAGNNAQGNFHINRFCGKFNAYQRTYVITAKEGYDIDYIRYTLEISLEHLKKIAQGSQTKFLTMKILDSFLISDIPYHKQKSIIASIKAIDQKIELNNKINTELEAMAKTIYDYWFLQFDFPNEEGKPYRSSGGKMVWNEQLEREIPEGWRVEPLQEHCEIIDCLHSAKPPLQFDNDQYYLLQLENIVDLGLITVAKKYYVSQEMYRLWTSRIEVREGDLVITNAGRVGAIARIPSGVRAGIGRNMTAIRSKEMPSMYLYYYITGKDTESQIRSNTDSGSFFGSLNVRGIKELYIMLPSHTSMDLLRVFESIISPSRILLELHSKES